MKQVQRFTWMGNGVQPASKGKWVEYTEYEKAIALLNRMADLYGEEQLSGSMLDEGMKLWRDYYEFTGDHMILTDEGWEPGEVKQFYLDSDPDSILGEVNAPAAETQEASR